MFCCFKVSLGNKTFLAIIGYFYIRYLIMTKKVLIGLTLLTLISNLSADIKPMIGIGFDAGGDELAGATFFLTVIVRQLQQVQV